MIVGQLHWKLNKFFISWKTVTSKYLPTIKSWTLSFYKREISSMHLTFTSLTIRKRWLKYWCIPVTFISSLSFVRLKIVTDLESATESKLRWLQFIPLKLYFAVNFQLCIVDMQEPFWILTRTWIEGHTLIIILPRNRTDMLCNLKLSILHWISKKKRWCIPSNKAKMLLCQKLAYLF